MISEKVKYYFTQPLSWVILLFGLLYSCISLVNHYTFRTNALDLGLYTNALWDYRNFQFNDSLTIKEVSENLLADHFDLYLILFSPLSYLFGTYTLLLVQIIFILIGGYGIYQYFKTTNRAPVAFYGMFYFYLFFGVYSALAFDYHSNVIASCLIPYLLINVHKKKIWNCTLLWLLIIVSKENISLWVGFIFISILFENWSDKKMRLFIGILSAFSFLYFVFIIQIIMPYFSTQKSYNHFDYAVLGNTPSEALLKIIQHPLYCLQLLFSNHTNNTNGDYVKLEFIIILCISGLPLLIKRPHYFIIFIPLIAQKFYNNNVSKWGIGGQYSIEFAPILAIGLFSLVYDHFGPEKRKPLAIILVICAAIGTIRVMDNTMSWTNKSRIRFYQKAHYQREYDIERTHQLLKRIPPHAPVSAQSPFLPHLALRDHVYQFPILLNADYIVYSNQENPYPLKPSAFDSLRQSLEQSKSYEIIVNDEITILKRKK